MKIASQPPLIPKSSGTTTSLASTPSTETTEAPFPYLNEYHKQHSEALMEEISKQPWLSKKEAYAQSDRNKALVEQRAGNRSGKPSTPPNDETT
jgi:hypothetical protein